MPKTPNTKKRGSLKATPFLKCLLIALPLLFVVSIPVYLRTATSTEEIYVKDKQVLQSNGSSYYLVNTETEVFQNGDSLLKLKFNSSDIQNQLTVGHKYQVTVVGARVPLFSWYRNIIRVESEVK